MHEKYNNEHKHNVKTTLAGHSRFAYGNARKACNSSKTDCLKTDCFPQTV